MSINRVTLSLCLAIAVAGVAPAEPAVDWPYAGQQQRDIKALSVNEIEALLAGKGTGFAKAAELNGYPGPLHVLELAEQLGLSADQRASTEELFKSMQGDARKLGRALIEEERRLDRLFASDQADPERIAEALERIAAVQARLRGIHLQAHLVQAAILTPPQVVRYAELRGYAEAHAGHDLQHGH